MANLVGPGVSVRISSGINEAWSFKQSKTWTTSAAQALATKRNILNRCYRCEIAVN